MNFNRHCRAARSRSSPVHGPVHGPVHALPVHGPITHKKFGPRHATMTEPEERKTLRDNGADARTRTADLRITNALLYQLSYIGLCVP